MMNDEVKRGLNCQGTKVTKGGGFSNDELNGRGWKIGWMEGWKIGRMEDSGFVDDTPGQARVRKYEC